MLEIKPRSSVERIAWTIMTMPDIEDCHVIEREFEGRRVLVAYLVETARYSAEEIEQVLVAEYAECSVPEVYVRVSAIPLTAAGEVNEEELSALPVLNADVLGSAEEELARAGFGGAAAFVIETEPAPQRAVHLADIFADWKRQSSPREEATGKLVAGLMIPAHRGVPAIQAGGPLSTAIPRNLSSALRRTASENGSSGLVYIQDDGTEILQSYQELLEEAERILGSLRKLGGKPQDRFIFQLRRNQDFIPVFWACQLGGFVPVPISIAPTYEQPNATVSKLHNAWLVLDKPLIVTSDDLQGSILGLSNLVEMNGLRVSTVEDLRRGDRDSDRHDSAPEDLAILLFTSGSTGMPKAVRQTQSALLSRTAATSQGTRLSSSDVFLNWMPLDHVGGIVMYHLPGIYLGARQIHVPTALILQEPLRWLDLIEQHRVTSTWAPNFAFGLVNAQAEQLAKRRWDLSTLVFILNAGESIVARTARHFLELLLPHGLPPTAMRPAWGMSETCSAVTYSDRFTLDRTSDADMFVQVGAPAPEFAFRIVDAQDVALEEGAIGRLQVRGPSVTLGYDRNPTANDESFTSDGWFITGDLGKIDDGQLTITGRQKEVIIVNGVNFYPHELEAIVEEVQGVAPSYSAVCAVREEGSDTDSVAVFFHPSSQEDIHVSGAIREIRGRMVRIAGVHPSYVVPLQKTQIPKTEIGKIQRTQLKHRLSAGEFEDVVKYVDVLTETSNTVPNWFFRKLWQPRRIPGWHHAKVEGCTVVFSDELGMGIEVVRQLSFTGSVIRVEFGDQFCRTGESHFVIDRYESRDYRDLFAAIAVERPIARVVHLATYGTPIAASGDAAAETMPVLMLARELAAFAGAQAIDLYVVSSGSQFVTSDERRTSDREGLPVLLRTLTAEEPTLCCRHIDVPGDDVRFEAMALMEELVAARKDSEVAYRGRVRYVPRLERLSTLAPSRDGSTFLRGGTYLLTGGLGGVAIRIARLLMTRYDARVLLTGRRPAGEAATLLEPLQALGDVQYVALDVCDVSAMEAATSAAEAKWGRALDGILHTAAVYHDGVLASETPESLTEIYRAKVGGAESLAEILRSRPKALFIAFSSVLSAFPGALVGAYAAANRSLENLTLQLGAAGFNARCIAWSTWRDTGMSQGQSSREALRAKGIREMTIEQGWNMLLIALQCGEPLVYVGLDANNSSIRRVLAREHCGTDRLGAYYLAGRPDAQRYLSTMMVVDRFDRSVPFIVNPLSQIVLTASGRVDRDAVLAAVRRQGLTPYVEPKSELERQICSIWQDVLDAPQIGAEDNFFMSGGHSLLATRVMSRLCSLFQVDLPLRSLFDSPTVAGLAAKIEKLLTHTGSATLALRRIENRSDLPLSFTQQRLWFLEQWQPGGQVYNIPLVFRVEGQLKLEALQSALTAVINRHESLRTTFHMGETDPVQRVEEPTSFPLAVVDLRDHAADSQEQALVMLERDVQRPFDLSTELLLRATVVRLGGDVDLLGLVLHHIAADGWSLDVLFREITQLYAAFEEDHPAALEPLPIQFADYAVWQRDYLQGPVLDGQLEYWTRQLDGAPTYLRLPTDKPRPATQSFRGAVHPFELPAELATILSDLCRTEQVTPFVALLTVFQIVLRQYSGQDDISVGSPIANRTHAETEGLVGFFANTLVLRTIFAGDPSFREMLKVAREVVVGAYAHQHMPFERLVEILKPARGGYNPLFQVNFRVVTSPPAALQLGEVVAERLRYDPGIARFDLSLELLATDGGLEGFFEYSTDLFLPATILRMQGDLEHTLRAVAKRPGARLSTLGLGRLLGQPAKPSELTLRKRVPRPSGVAS